MPTSPEAWQKWFEGIWAHREERIYPAFFGPLEKGIATVPAELFARLGVADPDPRWLHHGVLTSPPNGKRASWLFVTSGLSNPWGDDPETVDQARYSGLGLEFVIEAPEKVGWAYGVLHWLTAVQLLVASERLKGELVECWDRVPLRASIDPARESALRNLLLAEPLGYPRGFQLDSGKVDLMLCVGISDAEKQLAADQGGPALVEQLRRAGHFPITDPARASLA
jgi:hypothetical protein